MIPDEMVIVQGQRLLRRGYTTGTTATGATGYAIGLLAEALDGRTIQREKKHFVKVISKETGETVEYDAEILPIKTLKGITVQVEIKNYSLLECESGLLGAWATAVKESGDDPDVTHRSEISSTVYFVEREEQNLAPSCEENCPHKYFYAVKLSDGRFDEVELDEVLGLTGDTVPIGIVGGKGVGYVSKKGLAPRKGYSAINPMPRRMILSAVSEVLRESETLQLMARRFLLVVEISVKDGEQIAQKTFNPKIGILGGISILGTSGIVEPMSEQALVDTIRTELKQFKELDTGKPLLICPGNYGQAFAKDSLRLDLEKSVKISNFVGEALDHSVYLGIERALFVGHAGKLLKLAASVMNTHSSYADGRQEVMASHAALYGASRESLQKIMSSISIEEMLDALLPEGEAIFRQTMASVGRAMSRSISHRTKDKIKVEFIVFTNSHGAILQSEGAEELLRELQE